MKVQAKKYCLLILVFAVVCFLFQSCAIQKRKYTKGFYVQHKYHKEKPLKTEEEKNQLYCSAETDIVIVENETKELIQTLEAERESLKPIQYHIKTSFFAKQKSKTALNILPDKPNKNAKYKVSIFQINVMGLVSVCLIPVMIIAFFIPGAALLVWSALIVGALLALLCAFMIKGRPGAWMAGLAMGLWGLILLYFILILFVF